MDRHRKRTLRDLNSRVWAGEKDVFTTQGSLDSNMKKNTAFIRRLRTGITAASQDTFLQEIRTLSLHKYLSEIISASFEGLCKLKTPGEIAAGVEAISALHQRFGPEEYTAYLGWLIGRGLSTPDKAQLKNLAQDVREREEKERLSRQRVLLRVVTELWLVGAVRSLEDVTPPADAAKATGTPKDLVSRSKPSVNGVRTDADAEPFPLEVLKDMLGHDSQHVNLPLVVIFIKAFAWDMLGVKLAPEGRKNLSEDGTVTNVIEKTEDVHAQDESAPISGDDPPLVEPQLRERFKNILARYFEDVKGHLARDQKQISAQARRNAEAYVKSGEVFEDRQANYEKQVKAQEKLVSNAQVLADALGLEMPDLKEKDTTTAASDANIGLVKTGEYLRGQGDGPGIWEDEDERRFYENIIDLKDRVPSILLEDGKKKKTETEEQVGKKQEPKEFLTEAEEKVQPTVETSSSADVKSDDGADQSTAIVNKSVGAQVDALLARLPDFTSKDMVDETAVDFCFLNSKASRNKLVKGLEEVPKGRSDLLPFYARLVATLGKHMSDVSNGLVSYLDDEFRSLQRRKTKDFLGQVRMQNVRYLAELTKFGVVPEHIIFHCLKVSLDDFSRMNIEIISSLLENCGRYLLRNPETSPRMASFLETLNRKKAAQHLGQQERMLVENAMYYVNPPERQAIEQKERTPLDLFLRKLIYLDLTKRNVDKVAKQIRKLHWEEDEVVQTLEKIFSKPWKIKYSNVHLLGHMLSSLNRYHQEFSIDVVDNLLESITIGLEINDFKFNQRRIAEVKYLGELYIYRMVDSTVIFDQLYKIVSYGHEGGTPKPNALNALDLPDDYFRIRLVCSLLETCGIYFDKGATKKKLDFFLTFFQYYIYTKDLLPMDIEFTIQDAYAATRPEWKLAPGLHEAAAAFADAVKQNYQTASMAQAAEPEELEDESASDDGADDEDLPVPEAEEERSSGEEGENEQEDLAEPLEATESDSEEEQIIVTRPEDERDPEADADFDRELAKMMSESADSRKSERKTVFDVPLPMRRAPVKAQTVTAEDSGDETKPEPTPTSTMKFSLLSKKGNRPQTRSIDLPTDSNFAVALRTQQERAKEEQRRIKNLVLNYDMRNEDVDADGTLEKSPFAQPRYDKAGPSRRTQQARKLQLSDVEWYDRSSLLSDQNVQQPGSTRNDSSSPAERRGGTESAPGSMRGRRYGRT